MKYVRRDDDSRQERAALEKVQQAQQGQAGPHHLIQLLEAIPKDHPDGQQFLNLICK